MSKARRFAYRFGVAGTALIVACGATGAPSLRALAAAALEKRFSRTDLAAGDHVAGIIVPSGERSRMREAAALARQFPQARIVLTGDAPNELAVAREHGLQQVVVHEARARNTFENARNVASLIAPQLGERWLLVTSAVHMPRAIGSFRKAGLNVEPWPVYDLPANATMSWPIIRHELLGLAAYRLLGRTGTLLPGPDADATKVEAIGTAQPVATR